MVGNNLTSLTICIIIFFVILNIFIISYFILLAKAKYKSNKRVKEYKEYLVQLFKQPSNGKH